MPLPRKSVPPSKEQRAGTSTSARVGQFDHARVLHDLSSRVARVTALDRHLHSVQWGNQQFRRWTTVVMRDLAIRLGVDPAQIPPWPPVLPSQQPIQQPDHMDVHDLSSRVAALKSRAPVLEGTLYSVQRENQQFYGWMTAMLRDLAIRSGADPGQIPPWPPFPPSQLDHITLHSVDRENEQFYGWTTVVMRDLAIRLGMDPAHIPPWPPVPPS